jgi:hypothetical protein
MQLGGHDFSRAVIKTRNYYQQNGRSGPLERPFCFFLILARGFGLMASGYL